MFLFILALRHSLKLMRQQQKMPKLIWWGIQYLMLGIASLIQIHWGCIRHLLLLHCSYGEWDDLNIIVLHAKLLFPKGVSQTALKTDHPIWFSMALKPRITPQNRKLSENEASITQKIKDSRFRQFIFESWCVLKFPIMWEENDPKSMWTRKKYFYCNSVKIKSSTSLLHSAPTDSWKPSGC